MKPIYKPLLPPGTIKLRICTDCRRCFSTTSSKSQDARPPAAPKQYPDISRIRKAPDLHAANARARNYPRYEAVPQQITEITQKIAEIEAKLMPWRRRVNELETDLKSKDVDKNIILEEIRKLKPQIDDLTKEQRYLDSSARSLALGLPNLTSSQTPQDDARLLKYINYDPDHPPTYDTGADHSIIGDRLSLLDFASASTTSGWGFYYLLNEAALLEQALVQYAFLVALRRGWKPVSPPSLAFAHIAESCGFQPRDQNDEQQIWQVEQSQKDIGKPKRSLAATAEIPLASLYASKVIEEQDLPIKLIGSSRCYRAEAGARGVDTKGLYRVHEFTKVEMFAWTNCPSTEDGLPEEAEWVSDSTRVFDEMVNIQIEILSSLGLPCRVLEMPASDLGASAYRKIDIEAMFPSRRSRDAGWGEVTSVSICTDYQSRRLDTRIKETNGKRRKFPHTINGTAMAVPRVLAAILENGWREGEGCVIIPEVLRPYLGGLDAIRPYEKR